MRQSFLSWLLVLWLLISVGAKTDKQRKADARNLIKKQFHKRIIDRQWTKAQKNSLYQRYKSKHVYCIADASECWRISIHVNPRALKIFDRIYAFSLNGRKTFMGAAMNMGLWTDYDLVSKEKIRRPPCKYYCNRAKLQYAQKVLVLVPNALALRTKPSDTTSADVWGSTGKRATWKVEILRKGKEIRLKSQHSGLYLRFATANLIDVRGGGGDQCPLIVHKIGKSGYKLESKRWRGRYIKADRRGVRVQKGHVGATEFKILSRK